MLIVEMADTEQHAYFPCDTDTGSTLPNLPATTPNGRARRVTIVEGGYCSDVSSLEISKDETFHSPSRRSVKKGNNMPSWRKH